MELDNACYSTLKKTVSPNINYYVMIHFVELQGKTNG